MMFIKNTALLPYVIAKHVTKRSSMISCISCCGYLLLNIQITTPWMNSHFNYQHPAHGSWWRCSLYLRLYLCSWWSLINIEKFLRLPNSYVYLTKV